MQINLQIDKEALTYKIISPDKNVAQCGAIITLLEAMGYRDETISNDIQHDNNDRD